jgi:predicted transcriptional regulator
MTITQSRGVRLTADERRKIRELAEREHRTEANMMRALILDSLDRYGETKR